MDRASAATRMRAAIDAARIKDTQGDDSMYLSRMISLPAAATIASTLFIGAPLAENYLALQVGGMFGVRGTNLTAMEDLNYTGGAPNRVNATGSDITLGSSVMLGFKAGRYFDSLPGFGIEFDGQYGKPKFKRQDVTITLTNATVGGFSSFTEDQLEADFHMISGSLNLLYRFSQFDMFKPYIGAGPSFHALLIRGSGDSCHIVAPAALARGFCSGGDMTSKGTGIGFNVKAGVEIPINERFSFDAEYKFNYGKLKVDAFRSFSDIKIDYTAHILAAGLRFKF